MLARIGHHPIFCYGLSYGHYTEKRSVERQWGADRAKVLEPYKHRLAKLAIANRKEIEELYRRCFFLPKDQMSETEREEGAVQFRDEMQRRFGD